MRIFRPRGSNHNALEAAGLQDKLLIGGNLPAQDHDALRELGFRGIFPTGSKLDAITAYIRENVR